MSQGLQNLNVLGSGSRPARSGGEGMRVSGIEVVGGLDLGNVFRRELETKGLDVGFQVLDLTASEKRE